MPKPSAKKSKNPGKTAAAKPPKTNPQIYQFIDFFVKTGERIRNQKPEIVRGKDGYLVKLALSKLSESKLEMLAIWFFAHKQALQPRIGSMLSKKVLEELQHEMDRPNFWKEIGRLTDMYYPRTEKGAKMWQPFTSVEMNTLKQELASVMRQLRF